MTTFGKTNNEEKQSSSETAITSFGMPQRDSVNPQDISWNDPTYEEVCPREAPPEIPSRVKHSANVSTTKAHVHTHERDSSNETEGETQPKMHVNSTEGQLDHAAAEIVQTEALPEKKTA